MHVHSKSSNTRNNLSVPELKSGETEAHPYKGILLNSERNKPLIPAPTMDKFQYKVLSERCKRLHTS